MDSRRSSRTPAGIYNGALPVLRSPPLSGFTGRRTRRDGTLGPGPGQFLLLGTTQHPARFLSRTVPDGLGYGEPPPPCPCASAPRRPVFYAGEVLRGFNAGRLAAIAGPGNGRKVPDPRHNRCLLLWESLTLTGRRPSAAGRCKNPPAFNRACTDLHGVRRITYPRISPASSCW